MIMITIAERSLKRRSKLNLKIVVCNFSFYEGVCLFDCEILLKTNTENSEINKEYFIIVDDDCYFFVFSFNNRIKTKERKKVITFNNNNLEIMS